MAEYELKKGPMFSLDLSKESVDVIVDHKSDIFATYIHNVWMKNQAHSDSGPLWVDQLPALAHTFEEPGDIAQTIADRVRSYYADRFIVEKLKKGKISKFREAVYEFVQDNSYRMQAKFTGIMVKLPDFWNYDLALDKMQEQYNMEPMEWNQAAEHQVKTLTYVETTKRYISGLKQDEYWFKTEDNRLAKIFVQRDNPLSNVFERYLEEHQNVIDVLGYFWPTKIKGREDFNYIGVSNWKIN
jgi:hypothetical protein